MFYEEQFIDGILMWRNSPDGEWKPCSVETLNSRLLEATRDNKNLKMEVECEEKRFCELTDMFDYVCKERDKLLKRWNYYQEFTKVHGSNGITDLVVQRDKLVKERDELRAQLARCFDIFNNLVEAVDDRSKRNSAFDAMLTAADKLPKQAKHDAEVLQRAHCFYEGYSEDELNLLSVAGQNLWCAVHSAKENK